MVLAFFASHPGTLQSANGNARSPFGLTAAAFALLLCGLAPVTARAQLTVDNPNGVGTTAMTGIDGTHALGAYLDSAGNDHGFIYDVNAKTFTALDVPNAVQTDPFGIQGNQIVGGYTDQFHLGHGFLYDGTNFTTLNATGALMTLAHGISGGNIVGEYLTTSFQVEGFLYDGTSYTTLSGPAGAVETVPYGISGSKIVGSYQDATGTDHGFLYNTVSETYSTFDDPNAGTGFDIGTYASTIQGNTILGSYTDVNKVNHGFVYDGTNFLTLDNPLAGYNPTANEAGTFAYGLSGETVTGSYYDATGSHGYVVPLSALTPEPGSLALSSGFGIALFSLVLRRRRTGRCSRLA